MKKLLLKTGSVFSLLLLFVTIFGNYQYLYVSTVNATVSNLGAGLNQNSNIDILTDGITAQNAGMILSKKLFTGGVMSFENEKFTVVKGVKVGLQNDLKTTFQMNNKTRLNFSKLKNSSSFKGIAKYEDQILEYPDRVRLIMKTSYQYNNKQEYNSIFSGLTDKETISQKQVTEFLTKNPEYKKYSNQTTKLTKNNIINNITDKLYNSCLNSTYANKCDKNIILQRVKTDVDGYKGTRIITETVDVNKIPMIYDADGSKDFVSRLKESNISKQPGEVTLSNLQIKQSFAQYQRLDGLSLGLNPIQSVQTPKVRNCDGLVGQALVLCNQELNKLNANNNNTNQPITYSGTLLNGFTLGESYSYTLSDSYSVLGFTVYDIGVSFYAGYGVGIRIPIDYTVVTNKDRLEKGVSQNYSVSLDVDTVDKSKEWFESALGNNKAFDGKEAVLEAGAYAKGWIVLLDKTVFNEQIGGKYDWGKSLKMPFGDKEKLEIFEGIVEGNDIGLEVILYGIHISGDLKVEGKIKGDLSYECRTLASRGVFGDSQKCKDLDDTSLKDSDISDISIDPSTKSSTLTLKGDTDKYYYKNPLGVYQQFGVSLQRFKYKTALDIDLFLRGKVGVDTGEYFGWYWLETPWLQVYTFEIDLPDLLAHSGYSPKLVNTYENSYIYGFNNSQQTAPENLDISTKNQKYEVLSEEIYQTLNGLNTSKTTPYNAFMYGGKPFSNSLGIPVFQTNVGTNSDFYYGLISSNTVLTGISYHGNLRKASTNSHFLRDFMVNKDAVELQSVTNNVGQVNNNIAIYYSNASNAIWGTNLGGGKNNVTQLKNSSLNDTKIITLPGNKCSYTASGNQKFDNKREENCPVANQFLTFGGLYNSDGIIKANDVNGFVFPYKKFNFAFHQKFTQSSNQFFAYIAHTSNKQVNKVKIYMDGNWGEIQDAILGEPKYVQILDSNSLIIVFENYDSSNDVSSFTIQKYTFNNQWISDRLYQKTFTNIKNVTDFYYDEVEKTIFVSAVKRNNDNTFVGELYTVRFNGIDNVPFVQKIYSSNIDQEKFASNFNSLWPTGNWKITKLSNNGNGYVDTAISSLNVDLSNKTIYLNSYAYNGSAGMQYIAKVKYDSYPMAIAPDVEDYTDSQQDNSNPTPKTMGLGYNPSSQSNSIKYASTKMPGCDTYDVIIGKKVWSACNSDYNLMNSNYYTGLNETSLDINGWKFGKLYQYGNMVCPAGYKLPSIQDFKGLSYTGMLAIKLPLGGRGDLMSDGRSILYRYNNIYGDYWVEDSSQKNGVIYGNYVRINSTRIDPMFIPEKTDNLVKIYGSIRCVRVSDVSNDEIYSKYTNLSNDLNQTINTSLTGFNNSKEIDKLEEQIHDEYIESKLEELYKCYENMYDEHIKDILDAIVSLEKESSTADPSTKKDYESAILKLKKLKDFYIKKYSLIIKTKLLGKKS